jgi:predicted N-acetyltransferase YhbS
MVIRAAAPPDAEAVYRLLEQFVTSYRPQRPAFGRQYLSLVDSTDACVLVADVDETVVGYALALRCPTLHANGDIWILQELMVDPDHRSRGIGQALLAGVVDHARASGAVEVTVVSRRAGPYYVRHGFTETASYFKLKLTDNPAP